MKISTKCRYGLLAMIEIAKRHGHGAVKRREITKTQGITHGYLENILIALKAARLITTVRGAGGGFSLAAAPERITLLDIVQALEGSLAPVECVEKPAACRRTAHCAAHVAWDRIYKAEVGALRSLTLADMIDLEQKSAVNNYSI